MYIQIWQFDTQSLTDWWLGMVRQKPQCELPYNRTELNQASPLDTTRLARYGTVIIATAHQNNNYSY